MIIYVAPAWSAGTLANVYGFAGAFGVASNFPEDPNFSFVAYDIKSTIREKTFAHEAAHVMGARHQEQDDDEGEFEHAHSFGAWVKGPPPFLLTIPVKVRSMVWGGGPKRPRMPHYSNPDVEFLEKATGTESRDNARKIRLEGCNTSKIMETTIPFSVFIEGPIQVEPQSTNNFEAFVYGGQSPFEYDWYISFNGIDFQSLNDFNEVHSLPINSPVGTFIILKVEVTDDNDITRMGFLTIRVSEDEIQGFQISQVGSILSYVPNPATNQIDVTIEVLQKPKSELILLINDSNGNLIQSFGQKITTKGIHTLRVHIDSIPSGIMFIGLYDGRTVEDIKIILKI